MFRSAILAALAGSALASAQGPVATRRSMPAPLSTTQKALQADAVVVGQVTAIEAEDAEVLPFAGAADKVKWKVGVIKVETGLIGAKNVTHVKVLFPPPVAAPVDPGVGGPVVIRTGGGYAPVTLKEGEEGLYFLAKHPTAANYYVIHAGTPPVALKAETYKDDTAKVKAVVAALADPLTALTTDKIEDRLVAASVVLRRTRQGTALPGLKEVALPAEQTKAILKTLLDADWTAAEKQPNGILDWQSQPSALAGKIGLAPGSPNGPAQFQVKPGENYNVKAHEAFKAWHAKAGDTFEIKVLVPKE